MLILLLGTSLLIADAPASPDGSGGRNPIRHTFRAQLEDDHGSGSREAPRTSEARWVLSSKEGAAAGEALPRGFAQASLLDAQRLIREWLGTAPWTAPAGPNPVTLEVPPKVPAHLRRTWGITGQVELWFGEDGTPSRAHVVQAYKGRFQRIAPTEALQDTIDFTFKPEGDHLLIARREERREERVGYAIHRIHSVIELEN
jgi:hypothetical protein